MDRYPSAIRWGNIKPSKRICSHCDNEIIGRGHWMITTVARGKYLCGPCRVKWGKYEICRNPEGDCKECEHRTPCEANVLGIDLKGAKLNEN